MGSGVFGGGTSAIVADSIPPKTPDPFGSDPFSSGGCGIVSD